MTSEKQAKANRRNALKSTGPKTPNGKAAIRYNATKHGLLSREILLPGEDKAALRELDELLREELQPVGDLENLLIDRIVAAHWRLRRLGRVEAGIFSWQLYGELLERVQGEAQTYERSSIADFVETQDGLSTRITDEQKHQEALSKAQEIKAKQDAETATLGRTFIRDADKANAFSKLSRYETTIERSLYRALHELQRLQATRRTEGDEPLPAATDVDIYGPSDEAS
jgi:hypothetical protein